MHTFKCPHCTAPLNIDDNDARLAIKCEHCGMSAPVPRAFRAKQSLHGSASDLAGGLSDAVVAQVAALLARGQAIEAIKLVRQSTGLGLKEAKDMVDALKGGDADRLNVLLLELQEGRVHVGSSSVSASTVVINARSAARAARGAAGAGCGAGMIVMISLVVAGALFVLAAVRNGWFSNAEQAIPVALGTAVNRVSKVVVPPFGGLSLRDKAQLVTLDDRPEPDILALAYEPASSKTYLAYLDIVSSTVRWRVDAEIDTKFAAHDDLVYAASKSRMSAIDRASGAVRWEASLSDSIAASCDDCLRPDGKRVYVLSNDSELQAFDAASGRKMWSKRLAVVTPRIDVWDGAVVAIDRNDDAERLPAQVRVFDADGQQRVQFNLTCDIPRTDTSTGGSSTAQPYDAIWIDREEGALYAWFGGFSSCVQKRNLATGGMVWSAGFDAPAQGRTGTFTKAGSRIIIVGDKTMISIDAETGAGKVVLDAGDDYRELYPIGLQGDVAVLRALKARGSARFELWCIGIESGERRWTLRFDEDGGPFDKTGGFSGLLTKGDKRQSWIAHMTGAGLQIVRVAADPFRYRIETINPADGVSGGVTDVPISGDYTIISPKLLGWQGDVAWIHVSGAYNAVNVASKKVVYTTSPQ